MSKPTNSIRQLSEGKEKGEREREKILLRREEKGKNEGVDENNEK